MHQSEAPIPSNSNSQSILRQNPLIADAAGRFGFMGRMQRIPSSISPSLAVSTMARDRSVAMSWHTHKHPTGVNQAKQHDHRRSPDDDESRSFGGHLMRVAGDTVPEPVPQSSTFVGLIRMASVASSVGRPNGSTRDQEGGRKGAGQYGIAYSLGNIKCFTQYYVDAGGTIYEVVR